MLNKTKLLVTSSVFLLAAWHSFVYASPNGITGVSGKGPNVCTQCHSGGAVPTVTLTGPGEAVAPGSTQTVNLTIADGQQAKAGFNVAADTGITFTDNQPDSTQKLNGELTHTTPITVANGTTWTFEFIAPNAPGTYRIYASALSADGTGTADNDNSASAFADVVVLSDDARPIVKLTAPAQGTAGTAVQFDATESTAKDPTSTTLARFLWDFGDASEFATGVAPLHTYADPGSYVVTLAVTDSNGLTRAINTTINIAAVPGTSSGAELYASNCKVCHQADGGNLISRFNGDAAYFLGLIDNAISTVTQMASLSDFPADDRQSIADYLAGLGGGTRPTDGPGLYGLFCKACHGDNAEGGVARRITGAPFAMIKDGITNIDNMKSLADNLNDVEIKRIADFLSAGANGPLPTDNAGLYAVFCEVCHGVGGRGGVEKAVLGSSQAYINDALSKVARMADLQLPNDADIKIATYLGAGGEGQLPTDGAGLFTLFCSNCHGDGGGGTATGGDFIAVTGATSAVISQGISEQPYMAQLNLSQDQINAIGGYLVSGGGVTRPTTGPELYTTFCAVCHGADGAGEAKRITGASVAYISDAMANVNQMLDFQGVLSNPEIEKIAVYLGAGGGATIPSDGAGIYQVFCSTCHGAGGHGGDQKAVTGAGDEAISLAIAQQPYMAQLSLSTAQLAAVGNFLVQGGDGPLPTDDAGLYDTFCGVCHGPNGRGGSGYEKPVTGASVLYIQSAFLSVPVMADLSSVLSGNNELTQIAQYLGRGGDAPLPTDGAGLYSVFCSTCHGADGRGGDFKGVTGASSSFIQYAISNQLNMAQLSLSSSQRSAISSYLALGGSGPRPTGGAQLYAVYCSVCHGSNGQGDAYKVVTGASASFISGALRNSAMSHLQAANISSNERNQLEDFLASGGGAPKPGNGAGLYHMFCETCHGPNGSGGPEQSVRNKGSEVWSAIQGTSAMSHLQGNVLQNEATLIGNFLGN